MATGLSRKSNLSEKNLNLSEAIQKLYAPGIQDDIELFSLSSQIKSFITSGTELADNSQIIGIRSEVLKLASGTAENRSKFLTKDLTYSDNDKVFFETYLLENSEDSLAVNPVYSSNGSIPAIKINYPGQGYYFLKPSSTTPVVEKFSTNVTINGVVLKGRVSGSESARASVTFTIDSSTQFTSDTVSTWKIQGISTTYNAGNTASGIFDTTNTLTINSNGSWTYTSPNKNNSEDVIVDITYSTTGLKRSYVLIESENTTAGLTGQLPMAPINADAHLTKWTDFYTTRFYVSNVVVTDPGSEYIIGEDLDIVEGTIVSETINGTKCIIVRQKGEEYFGKDPIIKSDYYFYRVVNSSAGGFFLYDDNKQKHIYIAQEKAIDSFSDESKEIRIVREDFILIDNIFRLKFAQSAVYLDDYSAPFQTGDSITAQVYGLSNTARKLRDQSYLAIQNTKLPTPITSSENTLGFEYNKITGKNLDIWQRFIIRDQDYILGTTGVTGTNLGLSVTNFKLADPKIRVPGLFIKVGNNYVRAFSTTDKPYSQTNAAGSGFLNPNVNDSSPNYALYAANKDGSWYGYNTIMSKFAQRIASNGTDGGFYFHRSSAPTVSTKTSGGVTYYEAPLFTFVPN